MDFLYFSGLVWALVCCFDGDVLPELVFSISGIWHWLILISGCFKWGVCFLVTWVLMLCVVLVQYRYFGFHGFLWFGFEVVFPS